MLDKGVRVEGSGSRVKVMFRSFATDGFHPYQSVSLSSKGQL